MLEEGSAALEQLLEIHLHELQFPGQGFCFSGLELLTGKYTVKKLFQFFCLSEVFFQYGPVGGRTALKIVLGFHQQEFLA